MAAVLPSTKTMPDDRLEASADLHTFLSEYERRYPDEVLRLDRALSAKWEITALTAQLEEAKRFPIVVCNDVRVDGRQASMPLMTFLMASRLRLARALGVEVEKAGLALYERMQRRIAPVVVPREQAPVKQLIEKGAEVDLLSLPAPHHHQMDPGPYITGGFFLCYNRTSGLDNSALHRGWLSDRDEIRVLLNPHSHNWNNLRGWEQSCEDMPAAFWIGHHPLALLGAQTHVGPDESHYAAASSALGTPLRLTPSETLGDNFLVPADAEVVVEGFVPAGIRKPEGPFGEYTRYVGPQRWAPVMKVTAITRRQDALWDDVMVGHTHWYSLLVTEGVVYRTVKQAVPGIRAVHLPMAGNNAHIYLQIRKTVEGQGKAAAVAALSCISGNKHVFVFDEDVNIFNEKEVLQALAWRFQGDRGLVLLKDVTGSPLDPSTDRGVTAKVGFDCTKPLGKPFPERLSVPEEIRGQVDLAEMVGRERLERIPFEPWG